MLNVHTLKMSEQEYAQVRELLHRKAGISLGPSKQTLVCGRLFKRVSALQMSSYGEYFASLASDARPGELQTAIDLLTTNETYFYREPAHFVQLQTMARRALDRRESMSIWSAASSSGEEIYTIAMLLQQMVDTGQPLRWEILGSDISSRVIATAQRGVYPLERVQRLPQDLLHRYCLKGTGPAAGTVLVDKALRRKVRFTSINLIEPLPDIGPFDVIFLRNVLIYFDMPTKQKVLRAVLSRLRPSGVLFVGMAESLNGVLDEVQSVAPGAYTLRRA
jgi:chemotaxis protein methyltransferase CheR